MAQGFAFGTGSAIARTAVDSMFGGHSSAPAPAPVAASAPAAPATSGYTGPEACRVDYTAFNDCLRANKNDAVACEFYFNSLKQCQSSNI